MSRTKVHPLENGPNPVILNLMWFIMFGALFLFLGFVWFRFGGPSWKEIVAMVSSFNPHTIIFASTSLLMALFSFILPRFVISNGALQKSWYRREAYYRSQDEPSISMAHSSSYNFFASRVMAWALSDAIAAFGLAATIITKDSNQYAIFMLPAIILLLIHSPRRSQWTALKRRINKLPKTVKQKPAIK